MAKLSTDILFNYFETVLKRHKDRALVVFTKNNPIEISEVVTLNYLEYIIVI